MPRPYTASIGKSAKYRIYGAFFCEYYEGNWEGFVQWIRENLSFCENSVVGYSTDEADENFHGFTDAEKEFIEEEFGLLV